MNVHMTVTPKEFVSLRAQARRLKDEITELDDDLVAVTVRLFISRSARNYRRITISDPTYSRNIVRIEEAI